MRGLWMTLVVLGSLAVGCGESGPACGNGEVDPGEDELSCCIDSGCGSGICDEEAMACVDPWTLTCPAVDGQCSAEQPYRCDQDIPSYDCGGCGCPDQGQCYESVCYDPDVVGLERTEPFMPDDLPTGEYFSFIDWAATSEAMTYAELETELDAMLRADRRRNSLLLGETHGSDDEQALAYSLLRGLASRGWRIPEIGIEGETPILDAEPLQVIGTKSHNIEGDLTNIAHCDDLEARMEALNDQSLYVQYSGSGHTSSEICHHNMHWVVCDLPHTSACVTRNGRKAATVILFDPHVWMWQIDRTLLWRLPEVSDQEAFTAEMDANLARWDETLTKQTLDSSYDAELGETRAQVRILRAQNAEDAFVAFFPRPARPAYLHRAYRALWDDGELRSKLVANGLHPKYCSISWNLAEGEEEFMLWCSQDDYEITATVVGTEFVLDSWQEGTPVAPPLALTRMQGSTETLPTRLGY